MQVIWAVLLLRLVWMVVSVSPTAPQHNCYRLAMHMGQTPS